ncbi:MAG: glycosyltransferase involved in cell wall biosynthesis [Planctomycetota bacterium]|jgi:glycosyltransferase involved in cell wall biosynthesis
MTIEHESPPEETPVDPTVAGHVKDGAADSPVKDAAWPEESVLDVSVVVPVQSSDAEVEQVFDALGRELDDEGCDWEMFFVFDGVSGKAYSTVEALLSKHPNRVRIISFKNAFGESVCLSAAMERARGRYILTSPQYVQIDPGEIRSMLAALDDGADFVTPWRHPRVDPWLNRFQSVAFNVILRQVVRMHFHDLNCYFRAIRREVLDDVAVYGDMYRFLPLIAFRQGFRVVEVKVRHLKEWGTTGFFGIGIYARRGLDILAVMFLTKFTLKPLRFFGMVGGSFGGLGGLICLWMTVQKLFYGQSVSGRPMLLLGVLLIVLGVQIIGFGLVGEIIIFSQARNLKEYRIERIYDVVGSDKDLPGVTEVNAGA